MENISLHGLWLHFAGGELFVPFDRHPWFRSATVEQIHNVVLLHDSHFYWPDLDVDLELDSLIHPEKYPLCYHG